MMRSAIGKEYGSDTQKGRSKEEANLKVTRLLVLCNAIIMFILILYFFIMPFFMILYFVSDPALKGAQPSRFALWLHQRLSPRYERWAVERVISGRAQSLQIHNISGTEWPIFGSVFYLLGTEYLELGLQDNKSNTIVPSSKYAASAIEAATALVVDEGHAAWVKQHWGEDYRHRENVFYRMLLISGTASYHKLIGGNKYLGLLRDQVESLSAELDESTYGLLDDYPSQCFPTDVLAALAAIKRADEVLGTDHDLFLKRSLRGFEGNLVDSLTGLPPYMADASSGYAGEARGCSSQWGLRWAVELWPATAKKWYNSFDKYFWQKRFGVAGFREFIAGSNAKDWYIDVDSGPVLGGFGVSASAFGLGAARANGRFDHAYPLAIETIVLSWPLPNGTLLLPRFLSNASDAPYIGECAILFNMAQPIAKGFEVTAAGDIPGIIYWVLALYIVLPVALITSNVSRLKQWRTGQDRARVSAVWLQATVWIVLMVVGIVFLFCGRILHGMFFVLLCQLLPRRVKFLGGNITTKGQARAE